MALQYKKKKKKESTSFEKREVLTQVAYKRVLGRTGSDGWLTGRVAAVLPVGRERLLTVNQCWFYVGERPIVGSVGSVGAADRAPSRI